MSFVAVRRVSNESGNRLSPGEPLLVFIKPSCILLKSPNSWDMEKRKSCEDMGERNDSTFSSCLLNASFRSSSLTDTVVLPLAVEPLGV